VLLISHDRYLIDALATQIWAISPGRMDVFKGSYHEYVAVREGKAIPPSGYTGPVAGGGASGSNGAAGGKIAVTTKTATTKQAPTASAPAKPKPSMSPREREKRTAAIEDQIHKLEVKLVELSGDLGVASQKGEVDKVRELGEAYTAAQAELEAKMNEWETLLES
jgi:ATP-binding cassette subfamily F protein 3